MVKIFKMLLLVALASALGLVVSCTSEIPGNDKKAENSNTAAKKNKKNKKNKNKEKNSNNTKNSNAGKNEESTSASTGLLENCSVNDNQFLAGPNKKYFEEEVVKKVFENNSALSKPCKNCHIGPREEAEIRGDEFTGIYCKMYSLLAGGTEKPDPVNNLLMLRLNNFIKHPGKDYCPGGMDDPVCEALLDWWEVEFGAIDDRSSLEKPVPPQALVNSVDVKGLMLGYALDPDTPNAKVNIKIYIDGDRLSGAIANDIVADTGDFAGITQGTNGYKFNIPTEFLDGVEHKAYVYMVNAAGNEIPVSGSPKSFISYETKAEAYYDQNVQPVLQGSCGGCHGTMNYSTDWSRLVNPRPAEGGSATNNRIIVKGAGIMQHRGGSACGDACQAAIADWWAQEFGN